jgi:hypothetical protein
LNVLAWVLDRIMEILYFWTLWWAMMWGITPGWIEICLFMGVLLSFS